MLHRFKNLLKRFQRDERGAFLVLFGILAIVLIATSGAVVDFTQIEQARTRAQNALDAAVLGLQPRVFDTSPKVWTVEDFKREGSLLLVEQLADSRVTAAVTDATINVREGQLILTASITVPTSFVALVGVPNVSATLLAEATRKRLNLEVAMVLDNSGSMLSSSRMTRLKEAAASATDILFDYKDTQPNVYIGIVPFAQFVNVGPDNRTASWMSQTGTTPMSPYSTNTVPYSSLHFDNDNNDSNTFKEQVNRWDLYDGFSSGSWTGCVEARYGGFDTDDTLPNNAVPATMFFPVFAQDGAPGNSYVADTNANCPIEPKWIWVRVKNNCATNTTNATTFENANCAFTDTYTVLNQNNVLVAGPDTQPANGDASIYYNDLSGNCTVSHKSDKIAGTSKPTLYTLTRTRTCTYKYSTKELQQRLCKYDGATWTNTAGPNTTNCPITMLPLSNVRQTVKDKIEAMNPPSSATTNIAQGAIWGYHMLSPSEPLREARDYDEAVSKVMILMTDGENNADYAAYSGSTAEFGNDQYSAWGYRWAKRLLTESTTPKDSVATDGEFTSEINRRTKLACANAKAPTYGSTERKIKIYTIGLAAPAGLQQMLKDCASPDEVINGKTVRYWYFPTTSAQLVTVFEEIASQLSELRLAQ